MATDHYATLQVDPRADAEVVRAAYRALARLCHPDMAGGSHERMTALNEAWSVLRNPATRAAYDRERLAAAFRQPAASEPADAREPRRRAEPGATVLDFGRYAGWSLGELAKHDPDFLEWLTRTPIGRAYRSEIERLLSRPERPAPTMRPRARPAWARFR